MTVPKKALAIQTAASVGQHRVQTAGLSKMRAYVCILT